MNPTEAEMMHVSPHNETQAHLCTCRTPAAQELGTVATQVLGTTAAQKQQIAATKRLVSGTEDCYSSGTGDDC